MLYKQMCGGKNKACCGCLHCLEIDEFDAAGILWLQISDTTPTKSKRKGYDVLLPKADVKRLIRKLTRWVNAVEAREAKSKRAKKKVASELAEQELLKEVLDNASKQVDKWPAYKRSYETRQWLAQLEKLKKKSNARKRKVA